MNSATVKLSELYSNYKDWVRRNPQTTSEVEKKVKFLSYIVAGRFNRSVVLTELIHSASNLWALFNDLIICSDSAKYKLGSYSNKIKIWLTVLQYSEAFIEVSAKSVWGEKGKWVIIVCVQLFKCAARLLLLLHYKEQIISYPPILPCKRNEEKRDGGNKSTEGIPRINNIAFSLKRSGRVIRKVDSAPPLNSRLWKPPSLSSCNHNNNLEQQPDKALLQRHLIGEVLYTVKPIVNLLFIKKYGQHTWKPWTISMAMDLVSLHLLLSTPKNQLSRKFSPSQSLELSRRRHSLLLYLLRSPFYEKHSKNKINSFLDSLSRNVPLAGIICLPLQEYLVLLQEIYFYLWSS